MAFPTVIPITDPTATPLHQFGTSEMKAEHLDMAKKGQLTQQCLVEQKLHEDRPHLGDIQPSSSPLWGSEEG